MLGEKKKDEKETIVIARRYMRQTEYSFRIDRWFSLKIPCLITQCYRINLYIFPLTSSKGLSFCCDRNKTVSLGSEKQVILVYLKRNGLEKRCWRTVYVSTLRGWLQKNDKLLATSQTFLPHLSSKCVLMLSNRQGARDEEDRGTSLVELFKILTSNNIGHNQSKIDISL